MSVPINYVYLIATIPFCLVWIILFLLRKDTRREMIVMSLVIGAMSVFTEYYWWTRDWWHPLTITGTRVGIEDVLSGFASGGIIAVVYEIVLCKRYYIKKLSLINPSAVVVFLMPSLITGGLIWGVGLTSFISSVIAMIIVATVMFCFRPDLLVNGLSSGILVMIISLLSYYTIMSVSSLWMKITYDPIHLSNLFIIGVPIEEYVFWFLAGVLWGPFYEYWKGARLLNK